MTPPRRPLPIWIWDRALTTSAALCGMCTRKKLHDGPWHVCTSCDRDPYTPLHPAPERPTPGYR